MQSQFFCTLVLLHILTFLGCSLKLYGLARTFSAKTQGSQKQWQVTRNRFQNWQVTCVRALLILIFWIDFQDEGNIRSQRPQYLIIQLNFGYSTALCVDTKNVDKLKDFGPWETRHRHARWKYKKAWDPCTAGSWCAACTDNGPGQQWHPLTQWKNYEFSCLC